MGTLWNRSGQIERDDNDERTNAKAYFYVGSTNTPFQVYQDASESTNHAHPVVASDGRWPAIFIPFTVGYDIRVLDENDVELFYFTNVPNPDPVDVSVTIPAEEKVQTGMTHWEPINTTKSGYVRCNGRTIGNAASSATERANADTSALFTYLYNAMANAQAAVSGGRGASAAADYAANKTIALPDLRGGAPFGVDDMGNSAASRYPAGVTNFVNGSSIIPGSPAGSNSHILTTAQLPVITPAGSISVSTPTGAVQFNAIDVYNQLGLFHLGIVGSPGSAASTFLKANTDAGAVSVPTSQSLSGVVNAIFTGNALSASFTGTSFGSGNAHNILPYSVLGTWFMKL